MPDHFTIANLEDALARLNPSDSDSLIDDPIFQIFRKALNEPLSDLQDIWQDIFNLQTYPDILEYIVSIPQFAQHIHNNEPGTFIDYKAMRQNLYELQDYVKGGQQIVLDMYDFLHHFTGVHATFIRSTVSMAVWQLFSKMVDRFYGYISDVPFESFVQETVHIHNIDWPSYESVKSTMTTKIRDAQVDVYKAAQELTQLKSSNNIVTFTSHLATAATYKNKLTIENQIDLGTKANIENDLVEDSRVTRILSKYIGPRTRAVLASRRKAAIVQRNAQATQARVTKNRPLRQNNRNNIHQYGNMSRVPITDSVVRALSMIQETYRVNLMEDDDDEEDTVVGGMKGMSLEVMEEEMKAKEPLGGMLVGEGYSVVNVF